MNLITLNFVFSSVHYYNISTSQIDVVGDSVKDDGECDRVSQVCMYINIVAALSYVRPVLANLLIWVTRLSPCRFANISRLGFG